MLGLLTRRQVIGRGLAATVGGRGLAAAVAAALPAAGAWRGTPPASALVPVPAGGTLQAFFDTLIPGRRVATTVSGRAIDPRAIAGADAEPGAVEADALALGHHPKIGFDALAVPLIADIERCAAREGADLLSLPFDGRVRACVAGLDFANPLRTLWEAGAAVAFTAFCGAGLSATQTPADAPGWAVMGLPGRAPAGYADASYGRRLARERTRTGSLP